MSSEIEYLIFGYFRQRFRSFRQTGGGWWMFNDPFGDKKDGSSRVNFDFNRVMDMRSGLTYDVVEFIQILEGLSSYRETLDYLGFNIIPEVPTEYVRPPRPIISNMPLSKSLDFTTKDRFFIRGVEYLVKRGFDIDFLMSKNVSICMEGKYVGRIIIHYIEDNRCVYFTARDYFYEALPKYKNPLTGETIKTASEVLYNKEFLQSKSCYFVEGIMCAWTLEQAGHKAIATGGWDLSDTQKNLILTSPLEEVVVFADRAFYKKTLKQYAFLVKHKRLKVVSFDALLPEQKDVNDAGIELSLSLEKATNFITLKDIICA